MTEKEPTFQYKQPDEAPRELRDQFAGLAMQSLFSRVVPNDKGGAGLLDESRQAVRDFVATHAYLIADAMLKARQASEHCG